MSELARRVEAVFARIAATRMAGLPFVNAALRVELVGLRDWQGQWIGILVTPWSINIVLLPGEGAWPALPPGGERFVELPAGRYRFIAARDAELGDYHACSLFSPALEFVDHDSARAVAAAALEALFDARHADAPPAPAAVSRRDFLRGRATEPRDADRG